MNPYKARFQLKNLAKDRLAGKYADAILLLIVTGGIQMGSVFAAAFLIPFQNLFGILLGMVFSLLFSAVLQVLRIGSAFFYLNIACRQPFGVSNLFYGFREQPNKCLVISCVICGLSFLFGLPAQVCSQISLFTGNTQWMLFSYGADLLGELLFLPLSLALSQCYYLVLDYPELSAADTLRMSFRIMRGNKMRLFLLQLSFLPLGLLACLSFAIGFLWLIPYMQMTYALFFLDLMSAKRR